MKYSAFPSAAFNKLSQIHIESKGPRHPYIGVLDSSFKAHTSNGYMWDSRYQHNYTYGSTGTIWEAGNKVYDSLETYDAGDRIGFLTTSFFVFFEPVFRMFGRL